MDGQTFITLAQWLKNTRAVPVSDSRHLPAIGIRDDRTIDHDRTWLWALSDYRVTSVSGGTIWLMPKSHDSL